MNRPNEEQPGKTTGPRGAMPPLVPVVVQDAASGDVLMLAYADREALRRALVEREGWYFSRSRSRLWRKGESSGNGQAVVGAYLDCDGDAVLLKVRQRGPACHTGEASCFHRPLGPGELDRVSFDQAQALAFLGRLEKVIVERETLRPAGSYTASLFAGGKSRVLQKVGEEAVEFVLAAAATEFRNDGGGGGAGPVVAEAADLLYHLLVALRAEGVALSDVVAVLRSRCDGSE